MTNHHILNSTIHHSLRSNFLEYQTELSIVLPSKTTESEHDNMNTKRYRLERLLSEVTTILLFSRVTVTESPRAPALPPTLIRSWRNFSSDATSMILSSTGLEQSIVNVAPFFLPFGPDAVPRLILAVTESTTKMERWGRATVFGLCRGEKWRLKGRAF